MQLQTLRDTQVEILRRAFGDRAHVTGDRVLMDVTSGDGSIDVTDQLAAILTLEDRDANDPQDVIDFLRTGDYSIELACRADEDRLGLDRGALGSHVAGV